MTSEFSAKLNYEDERLPDLPNHPKPYFTPEEEKPSQPKNTGHAVLVGFLILFVIVAVVSVIAIGWRFVKEVDDGMFKTTIDQDLNAEFYHNATNEYEITLTPQHSNSFNNNNTFIIHLHLENMNLTNS